MKDRNKVRIPLACSEEDREEWVPAYGTKESAGADLKACISEEQTLLPGERILIPTGIRLEIPPGFEIQIRPRSGLAYKYGVTVLNTPATIDSDYRGEIKVLLIHFGSEPFTIAPKMRIAQAVLAPIFQAEYISVDQLCESGRGEGGFGHTGM